MERKQDETFEAYKARRAESNKARDRINAKTKGQHGLQGSRAKLRQVMRDAGKLKPSYGKNIIAAFARQRIADGVLPAKHAEYVIAQQSKKAMREGTFHQPTPLQAAA